MTLPPGPQPRPVVGNILQFRKGQLAFVTSLQREYGKASTFYFGSTPMVMFTTPEAVRYILVEHARDFTIREVTRGIGLLLGASACPLAVMVDWVVEELNQHEKARQAS